MGNQLLRPQRRYGIEFRGALRGYIRSDYGHDEEDDRYDGIDRLRSSFLDLTPPMPGARFIVSLPR